MESATARAPELPGEAAAGAPVTTVVLRLPPGRVEHRVDILGAALLAAGVSSLVLLTTWGGTQYAWGSPEVIGLGIAAVVCPVLFVAVESRAAEPIIPLHLFRMRVFTVASAVGFIVGLALFGTITYLPLFLQLVTGASATNSGLLLLPLMGGLLTSSIVSGQVISRTGRYHRVRGRRADRSARLPAHPAAPRGAAPRPRGPGDGGAPRRRRPGHALAGLVERMHPADGRNVELVMSERAVELIGHYRAAARSARGQLISALDEHELETMLGLMEKVASGVIGIAAGAPAKVARR